MFFNLEFTTAIYYTYQSSTMKIVFLVGVIAFNLVIVNSAKKFDLRRQVILSYIGNCPKKNNLPVWVDNFTINQIGKSEYVTNGQFEVKIDFPYSWRGTV